MVVVSVAWRRVFTHDDEISQWAMQDQHYLNILREKVLRLEKALHKAVQFRPIVARTTQIWP